MFSNRLCVCRVQQQVQQFQDSVQWGSGQWVCVHIRRTDLKIQHKVNPELPMQHLTCHHHGLRVVRGPPRSLQAGWLPAGGLAALPLVCSSVST